MKQQFFLFKAVRKFPEEKLILSTQRCIENHSKGIETSIFFDLNILAEMRRVLDNEKEFNNSFLFELVNLLSTFPKIYLSPGLALFEAQEEYKMKMQKYFNSFLSKYMPRFIDARNSADNLEKQKNNQHFNKLSINEKYLYNISYLSLLKINQINFTFKKSSSSKKFFFYINYMAQKANVISALEAEIAKYAFFDYSIVPDRMQQNKCKQLVKNYLKKYQTTDELFKHCLNAARDIAYYRTIANLDLFELDGFKQDTWLLTADKGLKALYESISFVPDPHDPTNLIAGLNRERETFTNAYWNYCDDLQNAFLKVRSFSKKNINYAITQKSIIKCIDELEGYFLDKESPTIFL